MDHTTLTARPLAIFIHTPNGAVIRGVRETVPGRSTTLAIRRAYSIALAVSRGRRATRPMATKFGWIRVTSFMTAV